MGASKSAFFSNSQNELANLFKALSNPARLAIIEYLIKVNSCICNDIVEELPLAQPTISQHLKELKQVGLIKGNIEGKSICYCINKETLQKIEHYFLFLENIKNTNCCQ
ncbi:MULTISPECIES: ArsR/SmtB family transcription factor [Flavobacterium]|uniref:ArsR family transcriptional regulator n=2 Tax=Flavobacterium TaxID=237 RepID=A0AA94JNV7_9FLAO|nr:MULTISPECIES: metalloregulator ArsR/SmtB family transcription factor [Flavobacterium]OXA74953.1 transcriptional regulator [Flavobacterium columnare] [Flavobacterium columnare NBRC 100251 = ATCC 23463]AMA48683.1 ArsR family transcriptional regulator [Flavobacterium covae]AND65197.1 transcriptional regulator [Flavobacterium covae]MCH4830636.1 winged helix-turn-helix transcriptional regulator [Flavobacterium columnare]MCH4833427.1 winged helix-turn-helix transcriptional regulator [Flavobacteri